MKIFVSYSRRDADFAQHVHEYFEDALAIYALLGKSLRLLKGCNRAKVALLERGQSVLNMKVVEAKLENIQSQQISQ